MEKTAIWTCIFFVLRIGHETITGSGVLEKLELEFGKQWARRRNRIEENSTGPSGPSYG